MTTLSAQATEILNNLRSYAESEVEEGWFSVYLDNAKPGNITGQQYAGYLSALQQAGFYKQLNNVFGLVRIA